MATDMGRRGVSGRVDGGLRRFTARVRHGQPTRAVRGADPPGRRVGQGARARHHRESGRAHRTRPVSSGHSTAVHRCHTTDPVGQPGGLRPADGRGDRVPLPGPHLYRCGVRQRAAGTTRPRPARGLPLQDHQRLRPASSMERVDRQATGVGPAPGRRPARRVRRNQLRAAPATELGCAGHRPVRGGDRFVGSPGARQMDGGPAVRGLDLWPGPGQRREAQPAPGPLRRVAPRRPPAEPPDHARPARAAGEGRLRTGAEARPGRRRCGGRARYRAARVRRAP